MSLKNDNSKMKTRTPRLDCHVDTLLRVLLQTDPEHFDFGDNPETKQRVLNTEANITVDKLRAGKMDGCFFAAFTADQGNTETSNDVLARMFHLLYRLDRVPGYEGIRVVSTAEQIMAAVAANAPLAIPCIEGGYGIEEDNYKEMIEQYRDLGVRYITLVWNNNNHLGSGTNADILPTDITDDKPEPAIGLTDLGARVIRRMEDHGILVDVSHMDDLTLEGTLRAARKPLIATHSNSDFINRDRRNLDDEQLRAIAATGGVVSLSSCNRFVDADKPKADMAKFLRHFEHIRSVIGTEHMGFGSDFDGATMIPELPDMGHLEVLRSALSATFDEKELDEVFGRSVLRLLQGADQAPQSLARLSGTIRNSFEFAITDDLSGGAVLSLPLCTELAAHLDRNEPGACRTMSYFAVIDGYRFPAERQGDLLTARIPEAYAERFRKHALFVTFDRGVNRITGVTIYGELMPLSM
ncbi:MAG: membrane dipeptidase [Bacillota bacterium]|nr:membrane dipeptidase [Bacillota bacterium]